MCLCQMMQQVLNIGSCVLEYGRCGVHIKSNYEITKKLKANMPSADSCSCMGNCCNVHECLRILTGLPYLWYKATHHFHFLDLKLSSIS
jgi:hypothetical protein